MLGAQNTGEAPGGPTGGALITQNTRDVPDTAEEGDYFGDAMTAPHG
jgi:hypothetical protein